MTEKRKRPRPLQRPRASQSGQHNVPRATRAGIEALIVQFNYPSNRGEVDDFDEVARALVREALRFGVPVPASLAAIAGCREPPAALHIIRGGRP